jgi:Xaa-Pro dipeptidase
MICENAAKEEVNALFPKFSNQEFARRRKALEELVERVSAHAVIISGSLSSVANLYYWTNYLTRSSSFFVANKDESLVTLLVGSYNHIPTAKAMSIVENVKWATRSPSEALVRELQGRRGKGKMKVALIGSLPYEIFEAIRSSSGCEIVDITRSANEIRAIKSEEEIKWLKRGAELTDKAMEAIEEELKPGMSEFEAINIIERSYIPLGGTTRIHYLVSTSMNDPSAYVPFQAQRNRRLRKGDIILTEVSAEYSGYAGQIHRPIAVAYEPTRVYERLFEDALSAYESVRETLRGGATAKQVVRAMEGLVRSGYTVCDSLVHGFGVDLMYPDLGPSNSVYPNPDYVFKANMAVVIQPNPVKDGRYGIQLGNLCLVRRNGPAISLQKFPMKFVCVGQ